MCLGGYAAVELAGRSWQRFRGELSIRKSRVQQTEPVKTPTDFPVKLIDEQMDLVTYRKILREN